VRPYNICAITFTNKAADEMRQRAAALGASAGAHISTFHSLCVRILRRYGGYAGIDPHYTIYDEADQMRCLKQALKDCKVDTGNLPPRRMLEAISTLKNKLVDVEAFQTGADDFFSRTLASVYGAYQGILGERNALDFDDLLMKAALLLEGNATVRGELSERFEYLLIDEYQDTNHAQYRLAKALAARHGNICATGDPDQSIYRWRGADIRNILAFERDWPQATIVRLQENFRSSAAVLAVADRLIACNRNRKEKSLIPVRTHKGEVTVSGCENPSEEAYSVAGRIEELFAQGVSPRDIAVFYRVNAMSRALEEAFVRRKIPYQIFRGIEFYNRKEIRDVLGYLRVLANPADEIAWLRIINTPVRGIGKVTVDRIRAHAARKGLSFAAALKQADRIATLNDAAKKRLAGFARLIATLAQGADGPVAPVIERAIRLSGLEASLEQGGAEGKDALENINELVSAAAAYDQQAETPSVIDYLQQIALFSDTDAYDATIERVALMTLHAAKGLEFEHIFILGLEDGLLPHERGRGSEEEMEEERRLFFVGVTRAKTNLHISYVRYRTSRGQTLRASPSQFLFELGPGLAPQEQEFGEAQAEQARTLPRRPRAKEPELPPDSDAPFAPGQLVRHKTFGLGRVKKFVDMGANSVVVIRFNTGQTKSLLLQYADLSEP
jgi:DNA helicase-2/ATP-dependent DNA helicase PcrA